MSNSRRASRPNTKKKNVISPLFTHARRSGDTPAPASRTDSRASHTDAYDDALALIHTSAATVAATSTAARDGQEAALHQPQDGRRWILPAPREGLQWGLVSREAWSAM
jgi:hypothetical protein